MEATNIEEVVQNISRIIITNPQKMIREEDLRNLCKNFEFKNIISKVYLNLKNVGFELITSKFLDQNYYILTSYGKDDNITPSQYGTLALILALSKEVDENIKIYDLKEIFGKVWNSDIKFLIDNDYIREFENLGIIKVTPLGKALLKNIVQNLQLKNLLRIFE
ncbi:MAG: hypothetical protein KAT66_04775 [Candidatus Lokiarchaeota archaeon]|nr:hypothetical protein [Candidatus Lokiarchaeota archaeon]